MNRKRGSKRLRRKNAISFPGTTPKGPGRKSYWTRLGFSVGVCRGKPSYRKGEQREYISRRWKRFLFESDPVCPLRLAAAVWRMAREFGPTIPRMDGSGSAADQNSHTRSKRMIWDHYVFRRGVDVEELWDQIHAAKLREGRPTRLLYITGRGFDLRANTVLERFLDRIQESRCRIEDAKLLLIGLTGYQLSADLHDQTAKNATILTNLFARIGQTEIIEIGRTTDDEDDISTAMALRAGADNVLRRIAGCTDVVLDVSSLPRISYLTILLSVLARLIPKPGTMDQLFANGVALHVLVGEDPALDAKIMSEDPGNDIVLIPGYAEALQAEALQDTHLVWMPLLGENRVAQLKKIESNIPAWAEICPILPHPSRNPRRGDQLLIEYSDVLISTREIPLSNIIYVHEAQPFEAYRQLLGAMLRYRKTMAVVGGCRLVVTPLSSKLVTIGAALACFEMKLQSGDDQTSVAIPYAEPKRYVAQLSALKESKPEISALILTGEAYRNRPMSGA